MSTQLSCSHVHVGSDDFLFLKGGKHSVFQLFSDTSAVNESSYEAFWQNIKTRQHFCKANDIRFIHLIFPEKSVVLKRYLLDPIRTNIRSLYTHQYRKPYLAFGKDAELTAAILYPLSCLRESLGYLRTDTHLSGSGYVQVAKLVLDRLVNKSHYPGWVNSFSNDDAPLTRLHSSFSGDLARMLFDEAGIFVTESANTLHLKHYSMQTETNGLLRGNDGIIDLVSSKSTKTSSRLLVFGDSFFRQMLPLMGLYFKEILFVRTRFFHYELIQSFRPSHIITSTAERYLSRVSLDSNRPHFLAYPLIKGVPTSPSPGFSNLWSRLIDSRKLATTFDHASSVPASGVTRGDQPRRSRG